MPGDGQPPRTREELEQEEEALCETLQAAEDLLQAKLLLQESLKEGWFNLSRARYHMGAGAVGRMQYDMNMSAHVRLAADETLLPGGGVSWSLTRVDESRATGPDVRQRSCASLSNDDGGDAARDSAKDARRSSSLPQAPLRWFSGAMPPPPLRAAQQHFFRALECVVDAANAHAKLASLPPPPSVALSLSPRPDVADAVAVDGSETDDDEGDSNAAHESSEVRDILNKLGLCEDEVGATSAPRQGT